MIYRVLIRCDIGGVPIYKWNCDCEQCLTTVGECRKVRLANYDEDKEKPQDTAIYTGLRR